MSERRMADLEAENATLRAELAAARATLEGLQDTELHFRLIADFTYDWECWRDPQGRFVYVSPSCERICGYPPSAFRSDPDLFLDIVHPEDRALVAAHLDQTRDSAPVCDLEFRIITKDGGTRWIQRNSQPMFGPDDTWLGQRGSNRDITETKQAVVALRSSSEELQRISSRLISAQEEERRRVARDLHDSLGSSLAAIKYMGEHALDGVCAKGKAGHMASFQTMLEVIGATMEELRRISKALRPSTLDDLGLLPTITWFARDFEIAYPAIHVETVLEVQESDIPEPVKIGIFRILQEALNNAAKYSQASRIVLSLRQESETLQLSIEDNGTGFESGGSREPNQRSGHGLSSMRERAELSGGTFALESAPGQGTRILAGWPRAAT